jgi:elongation factor G
MAYSTANIRNLALVGQAGAGKTSLTEALLAHSGAIRTKGKTERSAAVCDSDSQEQRLGHSIDAALVHFEAPIHPGANHAGETCYVNLIDTPGFPDFVGRSLSVLEAVETAAIVVNATSGIEPMTQRMMDFARDRELCRLIVINKIDSRDARCEALLAEIKETFGRECLPLNLPSESGRAVVDCFFEPSRTKPDFAAVEQAHTEIIDQVVELDDKLMALYLEQGEALSPEQLHDPFERALREGHLVPVCFVSAETGAGLPELVQILARLMPNPTEGNPPPFLKGEGHDAERAKVVPDPNRHVLAHVFKISIDPFVGRMGIMRIHQGTIRPGSQLFVGDGRKPFKVAHVYRLQGKEHEEIVAAIPGDICAVAKVEDLHFDAVLHDSHDEDHYHLKSIAFPPAMAGIAIQPERRGEEQKLSDALHKLVAEDPCVRIDHHAALNETVLYGLGELHLRVMLERMAEKYGVKCKTHPPSIPYRETITRPGDGHHRHKKQTGGAGQFGEVYLRVEPLPRGSGFEFVDDVVGGAIPSQFIPAVEKGVRQVLDEGVVAGFPLQDLRVSVYDGKHHAVDSKEVAFIAAGRRALQAAIESAAPIVLEPIVRVEITAPSDVTGDITGDLATRRGRISGSHSLGGQRARLTALVPLAELTEYQTRLKSLTGGEGTYTMDLSHYDPVPGRRQQELVSGFKRVTEE